MGSDYELSHLKMQNASFHSLTPMLNILFYKYVDVEHVEQLRLELLERCLSLGIKGKILIATEGINGCVTGSQDAIATFKRDLNARKEFADIEFKDGVVEKHSFNKTIVRIRDEIVTTKFDVDLNSAAAYIEPEELKELLASGDDVILVDARNGYESKIGKFKGAIAPDLELFSQWPEAVTELEDLKERPIVTYCTGGIRCEKASAYMKEQGFKNVKQLHGGIIRYGLTCGNDFWEGKCFVFDKRGAIEIDPAQQTEAITQCEQCHIPTDEYYNCANVDCDRWVILCDECREMLKNCCSKRCRPRGTPR